MKAVNLILGVYSNFKKRLSLYDCLFIFILVIALVLRVNNFDYPLGDGGGEPSRDYLTASKISADNLPLVGPPAAVIGGDNSPSYYYVLKLFLLVKNDFIFLQYVNIVLQVLSILLIYLILKNLFYEPAVATIVSIVYSFSPAVLRQSLHVWQPYLAQPFVLLAVYLILKFYRNQKPAYMYVGLAIGVLSLSLHYSALVIFLILCLFSVYILRKRQASRETYVKAIAVTVLSFAICYGSVAYLFFTENRRALGDAAYSPLSKQYWDAFSQTMGSYFKILWNMVLNFYPLNHTITRYLIAVPILAYSVIYTIKRAKEKDYLPIVLAGVIFSAGVLVSISSSFSAGRSALYEHHFVIFIPFILTLLLAPFGKLLVKNQALSVFICIQLLVLIFPAVVASKPKNNRDYLYAAADSIIREADFIRQEKNLPDLNFFQIEVYRSGSHIVSDFLFWNAIDERYSKEFIAIDKNGNHPNGTDYYFLACLESDNLPFTYEQCEQAFKAAVNFPPATRANRSNYAIIKKIHEGRQFTVLVAKDLRLSNNTEEETTK